MSNDPNRTDDAAVAVDPPCPRAFATTTGLVFQIVGIVYVMVAGGYWLISGRIQAPATYPVVSLSDYISHPQNILLAATTANILVAVAGGMAMVAFGVGLQGERRRSGTGAMIVAAVVATVGLMTIVVYIVWGPAWCRAAVTAVHVIVACVLFLLAGESALVLKQHPPPKDQNTVDDAWLAEYERQRRARRDESKTL